MIENTKDVLIHRIASNEASRDDFRDFEDLAANDSAAWESLARSLRDELQLRSALANELDGRSAEREINLAIASTQKFPSSGNPSRGFSLRVWSGWAAAAVLALALVLGHFDSPPHVETYESVPDVTLASLTTDELYNRYLDLGEREGRLVAEMPTVLVESRPTNDGRFEVMYLRQLLERAVVGSAYELHEDELGRPVPIPVNLKQHEMFEYPM